MEQVEHTGAGVGPAQVLEHEVRAEAAGLQLSPGNNTECHNSQHSKYVLFLIVCGLFGNYFVGAKNTFGRVL